MAEDAPYRSARDEDFLPPEKDSFAGLGNEGEHIVRSPEKRQSELLREQQFVAPVSLPGVERSPGSDTASYGTRWTMHDRCDLQPLPQLRLLTQLLRTEPRTRISDDAIAEAAKVVVPGLRKLGFVETDCTRRVPLGITEVRQLLQLLPWLPLPPAAAPAAPPC